MKQALLIVLFHCCLLSVSGQDSSVITQKWKLNGYVKDLQSLNFNKDFRVLVPGNILHNRMNLRWTPQKKIQLGVEWRNRFFWGEEMASIPNFLRQLRSAQELVNLNITWLDRPNYALITQTDRFWAAYENNNWSLRLGRQRINWGQTTTWNPNDLFNTYNFLDFDYEERPGTDALNIERKWNDFSSVQWVAAPQRKIGQSITAVKYSFNQQGYDFQVLAGWYKGQITVGSGWAGSIGEAGFKGEVQYYLPASGQSGLFNSSIEIDYAFKKGWYVNGGLLFNSGGTSTATGWETLKFDFSPKYLMPTRWNMIATTAKAFTPRFSLTTSLLYAPGSNLLLILPALKYNLADDLDADLIGQSFFYGNKQSFEARQHRLTLRLKWNF